MYNVCAGQRLTDVCFVVCLIYRECNFWTSKHDYVTLCSTASFSPRWNIYTNGGILWQWSLCFYYNQNHFLRKFNDTSLNIRFVHRYIEFSYFMENWTGLVIWGQVALQLWLQRIFKWQKVNKQLESDLKVFQSQSIHMHVLVSSFK